jgi:CO/xanthine dehydrogenase Mo-binding subunit
VGAKGVGEPPIIPTAAALANALADALQVRIKELPISRDKILQALAGEKLNLSTKSQVPNNG